MRDLTINLRPAALTDLPAVLAFCHACEEAVASVPLLSGTRLRGIWTAPGFEISRSTRIALTEEGDVAGYAAVLDAMNPPVSIGLQLYVHPHRAYQGIGETLLAWAERRAREALSRVDAGLRVVLWANVLHEDEAQIALLRRYQFCLEGIYYKMQIELDVPPPVPVWPAKVTVSSFSSKGDLLAHLPAVMTAVNEAFQDQRGYVARPLSERIAFWTHRINNNPDFDPGVWYVAREGEQIAGFCLCSPTFDGDPHKGHVHLLGVRRPWRRQGLGLALLRETFREFYKRGKRAVDLGVDAASPTGATRLYERAGMQVVRQYDEYKKVIQPAITTAKGM